MNHFKITAVLAILIVAISSCKKADIEKTGFDIQHPEGYCILIKQIFSNTASASTQLLLIDFQGGKTLKSYSADADTLLTYTLADDKTIAVGAENLKIVIDGENVSLPDGFAGAGIETFLIKKPETDQLRGKTYAGTYYKPDGSVLLQNYYYSFNEAGSNMDVGPEVGTVWRKEAYESVCNIAAYVDKVSGTSKNGGDSEFMVLLNGKLEANYYDKSNTQGSSYYKWYASMEEQP